MLNQLMQNTHNPDVLTCIANLSSDEVFTPPELASAILDMLAETWAKDHDGESIWNNPDVTFLDPFTKSGVFLREITQRLTDGLAEQIPDIQERVNHILTKQVYGIGITNLTAMLARRSVYCSKLANGKHSICTDFATPDGNIWFERTEHSWSGGARKSRVDPLSGDDYFVYTNRRCSFCGAKEDEYGRGEDLETHAYAFIHTNDITKRLEEIFGDDMHFDVICGNPPYQLSDSGAGRSALPIYQRFIKTAKDLDPKYLVMVTPSRWMAGGKGLNEFRTEMLSDRRIRKLVDYLDSNEAFPGVDIAGGVSYFLWNRDHAGTCELTSIIRGNVTVSENRKLDEHDVFVRHSSALSILRKVWPSGVDHTDSLGAQVSGRKAFGFATNDRGASTPSGLEEPIVLVSSKGRGYVDRKEVTTNSDWINKWKATVSRASPAGGRPDSQGRFYGLSSIRVIPPGEVTTEAYPVVGAYDTEAEAENMCAYLRTKFLRFLLTLRSANQSVTRNTFNFVPSLPMDQVWNDSKLNEKYGLSKDEIEFINSMVRPMEDE